MKYLIGKDVLATGAFDEPIKASFTCRTVDDLPMAGAAVAIVNHGEVIDSGVTDATGAVQLLVSRALIRSGAVLRQDDASATKGSSINFEFTAGSHGKEHQRLNPGRLVQPGKASLLTSPDARVGVYFGDATDAPLAKRVLAGFAERDSQLTERFNVRPRPTAIFIAEGGAIVQGANTPFDNIWVLSPDELPPKRGLAVVTHERVEDFLRELLPSDSTNDPRWLYDGLADLLALRVEERTDPRAAAAYLDSKLKAARSAPERVFDLLAWRSIRLAGSDRLTGMSADDLGAYHYSAALALLVEALPNDNAVRALIDKLASAKTLGAKVGCAAAAEALAWPAGTGPGLLRSYTMERALSILQGEHDRLEDAAASNASPGATPQP